MNYEEKIIWNGQGENNVKTGLIVSDDTTNNYFRGTPDIWRFPVINLDGERYRINLLDYQYIRLNVRLKNSPSFFNPEMMFYSWYYSYSNSLPLGNYLNLNTLYDGNWHTIEIPITDFIVNNDKFIFDKVEKIYFSKQKDSTSYYEIEVDDIKAIKYLEEVAPIISFYSDITSGTEPLTVQFYNDSSSYNSNIIGYLWDFGDGKSSIEKEPVHTYDVFGNYTVSLSVMTDWTSTHTNTLYNYINVEQAKDYPEIDFSCEISSNSNPAVVKFKDLTNPNKTNIIGWHWSFGDHYTSKEQNPTYVYLYPGRYDVNLQVYTDNSGIYNFTKENFIVLEDSLYRPPKEYPLVRFNIDFKECEFYILDAISYMKVPIQLENNGTTPLSNISLTQQNTQNYLSTLNDFSLYPGETKDTYMIYIRNNLTDDIENVEKAFVEAYVNRVINSVYEKFKSFISLETLINMIKSIWK